MSRCDKKELLKVRETIKKDGEWCKHLYGDIISLESRLNNSLHDVNDLKRQLRDNYVNSLCLIDAIDDYLHEGDVL